jgi:hypothetical protein
LSIFDWIPRAFRALEQSLEYDEQFIVTDDLPFAHVHGVVSEVRRFSVHGVVAATDRRLLYRHMDPAKPLTSLAWGDIDRLSVRHRLSGDSFLHVVDKGGRKARWEMYKVMAETLVVLWQLGSRTGRLPVDLSADPFREWDMMAACYREQGAQQ